MSVKVALALLKVMPLLLMVGIRGLGTLRTEVLSVGLEAVKVAPVITMLESRLVLVVQVVLA
jgi:hypothetical protein